MHPQTRSLESVKGFTCLQRDDTANTGNQASIEREEAFQ